ncbi:MAG: hypothetical protein MUP98_17875, partial [Candidatus Aminicenantes bacterium]|nr:hypothetical protein [Candidatus Aminicenantes bacterium]
EPTEHPKIFRVRDSEKRNEKEFLAKIERLVKLGLGKISKKEIFDCIKDIVPVNKVNHKHRETQLIH